MYLAYHDAQQAAQALLKASDEGHLWLLCVSDLYADAQGHEEWRVTRKDASSRVVDVAVVGVGPDRQVSVDREVAARLASEAKFKHLMDEMPIGLCQVNPDGRIYHRNRRFMELFGYDDHTVPTLTEWWAHAYPDPDYRQWVQASWDADVETARVSGQEILSREYRVTTARGDERYVQIGGITFDNDFMAVFVDNTARRLAEMELERHRQHLERLAQYDALTGLANRALFSDRLDQALLLAQRERSGFALLYIDLDGFKPVNDSHGHAVGDVLLKLVGDRMLACVRESDTVARIGGDEFVILLHPCDQSVGAARVAEEVRSALCVPFDAEGHVLEVSTSIGVAVFPADGQSASELWQAADRAMYCAKRRGRNTVAFSTVLPAADS